MGGILDQLNAVDFQAGLDDAEALGRLYWGITGQNPLAAITASVATAPPPRAAAIDPRAAAVDRVAEALIAGDATFLLGRASAGAHNPQLPAPCELSARLLRELSLVDEGYDGLVPGVESVASLLAATSDDDELERCVVDLLEHAGDPQPGVHAALAALMKLLGRRPAGSRARHRRPRLILTTNFDLLMERALLRAGLPFSRLVQFRSEPRIDVTVFDDVALAAGGEILVGGHHIPPASGDALDDEVYSRRPRAMRLPASNSGSGLSSLAIDQLPDPILYKFHGSQDIEKSCAISSDQCFDFAWRLLKQECVPNQITEIIGNSTLIALGASVLDHDFRLTYHTLLRKPLEIKHYARYAIASREDVDRRDPNNRVAAREWEKIAENTLANFGIRSVDATPPFS